MKVRLSGKSEAVEYQERVAEHCWEAALVEGVRILAETEPVVYSETTRRTQSNMSLTVYGEPGDYSRYGVAHGILADAIEQALETGMLDS